MTVAPSKTREANRTRGRPGRSRLYRLRWVPLPLALLAAMLGLLVAGSLQGQAAANRASLGYEAGGLALQVNTMSWMSNDMTGQGPQQTTKGFTMDPSMMPGMQTFGNDRLRVEVNLRNVTSGSQAYSTTDFSVTAPDGQHWNVIPDERSNTVSAGTLEPGFTTTFDLYFDVPSKQIKHLTVIWSRGGNQVAIPVQTSGQEPGVMRM